MTVGQPRNRLQRRVQPTGAGPSGTDRDERRNFGSAHPTASSAAICTGAAAGFGRRWSVRYFHADKSRPTSASSSSISGRNSSRTRRIDLHRERRILLSSAVEDRGQPQAAQIFHHQVGVVSHQPQIHLVGNLAARGNRTRCGAAFCSKRSKLRPSIATCRASMKSHDSIQVLLRRGLQVIIERDHHPISAETLLPSAQIKRVAIVLADHLVGGRSQRRFKTRRVRIEAMLETIVRISALDRVAQRANYFAIRNMRGDVIDGFGGPEVGTNLADRA